MEPTIVTSAMRSACLRSSRHHEQSQPSIRSFVRYSVRLISTDLPNHPPPHFQEDALAVCAKLEGCTAMTCLPNDNYRHLFPPQNKMPDGSLLGDDLLLLQAAQVRVAWRGA